VIDTKRVESATVWTVRRAFHPSTGKIDFLRTRAVLAGDLLVGVSHACNAKLVPSQRRKMSDAGPVLLVSSEALGLGGDPDMTVSFRKPSVDDFNATCRKVTTQLIADKGVRQLFAEPGEMRAHPLFVDPYSDLAVFGDHPDSSGTLETVRRKTDGMPVRRRPIVDVETVHVSGLTGWTTAIVRPFPGPQGPSVDLVAADNVFVDEHDVVGGCGGPVVDSNGELVGVVTVGKCSDNTWRGPLTQLCRALPPWLFERITTNQATDDHPATTQRPRRDHLHSGR
jgi:hypothetical protein